MTKEVDSKESVVIHKQMTIEEILALFPFKAQRLAQEITNAGLHCVGCHAATWETLEAGMLGHGKTVQEIDTLVSRLNQLLAEKVDHSTISLTARAAEEFRRMLDEEEKGYSNRQENEDEKKVWGLRFGIRMSGCSGFEYELDYSDSRHEDDVEYISQGIPIRVKNHQVQRLIGSEIDFRKTLQQSGFVISNPNVKTSCGCGSSHGY